MRPLSNTGSCCCWPGLGLSHCVSVGFYCFTAINSNLVRLGGGGGLGAGPEAKAQTVPVKSSPLCHSQINLHNLWNLCKVMSWRWRWGSDSLDFYCSCLLSNNSTGEMSGWYLCQSPLLICCVWGNIRHWHWFGWINLCWAVKRLSQKL